MLEITADDNILAFIKTDVSNGKLNIYLDNHYNYNDISVKIDMTVHQVNGIENQGTGNVTVFDIPNNNTFNVKNKGTGDMLLTGETKSLKIYNEGTGEISSFGLNSIHSNIEIIGSGHVRVTCTDVLQVKIEGSGNVFYQGSPDISSDIKGSGDIIAAN